MLINFTVAVFEPDNKENEDEYKKIYKAYKNLVRGPFSFLIFQSWFCVLLVCVILFLLHPQFFSCSVARRLDLSDHPPSPSDIMQKISLPVFEKQYYSYKHSQNIWCMISDGQRDYNRNCLLRSLRARQQGAWRWIQEDFRGIQEPGKIFFEESLGFIAHWFFDNAGRLHAWLVHGGHWHHPRAVWSGLRRRLEEDQESVPPIPLRAGMI